MYRDKFIQAIHDRNQIQLSFFSKDDGSVIVRRCAPMDFGPSSRAADKSDRYHCWDYDSDKIQHVLSLLPNQIKDMTVIDKKFEPSEFVTGCTIPL